MTDPRGDRLEWTALGNVDLAIYDTRSQLFLYTVTHEGLIFVRER